MFIWVVNLKGDKVMWNGKRKLIVATALVCTLGVGIANPLRGSAQPVQDSAPTSDTNQPTAWLRISAFTDIPVAGGSVAVYDREGNLLFEQDHATNDRGVFPMPDRTPPRDFRVTVTWNSSQEKQPIGVLTLSADVRNFHPAHEVVYLDPVTTIVSRLLDRDPELSLEQAQNRVRQFLDLPPRSSLGAALRDDADYSSPYFSETGFVTQASQDGGFDQFVDDLVINILYQPNATHLFASEAKLSTAAGTALNPVAAALAKSALSWGIGWVMQSAGLSTPGVTPQDIQNIQEQLDDLQSSVDDLRSQLQGLEKEVLARLTQTQYNQIVVPAIRLATEVNGVESDLSFFAQACPPLPGTAAESSAPALSDFCSNQKATITGELNDLSINQSFGTISAWLLDNQPAGFRGMLHLFSQALGETVYFFRPADSTKMQNMFNYWDAVQTQAANLKVELLHLNGAQDNPGGIAQLTGFLGNPNADPATKGTFQDTRDRELQLIFPPVPIGTVINVKDRRMWATGYPKPADSTSCLPGPPRGNGVFAVPVTEPVNWNGISDWRSPSVSEAQTPMAGGGSNPISWLIDQTKAVAPDYPLSPGLPNVATAKQWCSGGPEAWTQTPTGKTFSLPGYQPGAIYFLFRVDTGAILTPGIIGAAGYHFNWEYLVRELAQGEQYYWYP
jgi:hypothetical protein